MGLCADVSADDVLRRGAGLEVFWRPALSGRPQVQPLEDHGALRWDNDILELLSTHSMQHRDWPASGRLLWHRIMPIFRAVCTALHHWHLLYRI